MSPLKFNEPSIPGNESKKIDLKNVSLKLSQAINLFPVGKLVFLVFRFTKDISTILFYITCCLKY